MAVRSQEIKSLLWLNKPEKVLGTEGSGGWQAAGLVCSQLRRKPWATGRPVGGVPRKWARYLELPLDRTPEGFGK